MSQSNPSQPTPLALPLAEQEINAEYDRIYERAMKLADEFWTEHWAAKKRREQGYLGIRVRRRSPESISIEWFRARYRMKGAAGENSSPYMEYIRRGSAHRYPLSAFRRAKDWELKVIDRLEEEFGVLRKRLEQLGKLRLHLKEYRKLTEQNHQEQQEDG